jgi:mycoredoxin-dependent peroxiredoxin
VTVQIGDQAPDFELKDQTGQPVRLSDYQGKKAVVLVFYPMSFTGVCEHEMCAIRDEIEIFRSEEVETIAVSVDSPASHRRWAEEQGFEFPMLSDFWPHGDVAQTYGVFDEQLGVAVRGTFIIDKTGDVIYVDRNPIPEARDPETWKTALGEIDAI